MSFLHIILYFHKLLYLSALNRDTEPITLPIDYSLCLDSSFILKLYFMLISASMNFCIANSPKFLCP